MSYTEDLAPFLADFGVDATVGAAAVRGIFDNAFLAQLGLVGTDPLLLCRTSDVASATRGTAVTLPAGSFKVVRKEPDGTGMSRLVLEAAA